MKTLSLEQMENVQGGNNCSGETRAYAFGALAGLALGASGIGVILAGIAMTYCMY